MSNEYISTVKGLALGPSSTGEIKIGLFSSAGDNQFALSASLTKAFDVCADDGGTALTAASVRSTRSRMLIRTAVSGSPDLSVFGLQGQLKVGAVAFTTTGHVAGLWGYFESISGASLTGDFAGVYAMADLPTGATLASGAVLAGLTISSNDLGGTSTGDMACIYMPNPVAGTWDYMLQTGDTPGFTSASDVAVTANLRIAVKIGGTVHYIPLMAST